MTVPLGMPKPRSMDPATTRLDTTGRPQSDALLDRYDREADDLRVSLTDFCNLRCTYCMPEMGMEFLKKSQLMSVEEIVRLVRVAVERLGVRQVRFTGGEPLTRPDLAEIIAGVAVLQPRPNIALTTNAIGLDARAQSLVDAGLDRINVSLDSVVTETFERMTRRPLLHRVLAGLEGAQAAGLDPIKVNAVLQPGVNDHEVAGLLQWCLDRGFQLRIIEYMPIDGGHAWNRGSMITAADVHRLLSERFVLSPVATPRGSAPAELFEVRERVGSADTGGGPRTSGDAAGELLGTVGIIASVTQPFCEACTRTRLTAEGRVRTCLFSHEETDLLGLLRGGGSDEDIAERWRAAHWGKQQGHGMNRPDFVQPDRPMSAIGG